MTTPENHEPSFVQYQSPDERKLPILKFVLLFLGGIFAPLLLTYGYATHDEVQITAIVISVVCLGIGLVHPFWGLVFFVGLLYIRPEDSIPALRGLHLTLIASVITIFSVFLQKVMDKTPPLRTPLDKMLVLFALMAVISTAAGGDIRTALTDASRLVILVFMVLNLVNTRKRLHIFLAAVLILTSYLSCYSIYLFFNGSALARGSEFQAQGTGIFGDPNDLSATIVAGFALAVTSALKSKGLNRGLMFLLSAFFVYSIFLTNSRGGMIALIGIVGSLLFLFLKPRWLAIPLAIIVGFGMVKFGPSRMSELDSGEESANSRFWFWSNGVHQLIAHPLTGVGYGQFTEVNDGMTAHNSFVLCFAELGLPGYFFWIGCIYYCFVNLSKKQDSEMSKDEKEEESNRIRGPSAIPIQVRPGPKNSRMTQAKPEIKKLASAVKVFTPAEYDRLGAQLALGGFLLAAFFISRTYVPVLYLLMSLPVVCQIANSDGKSKFERSSQTLFKDYLKIGAICIVSILAIYVMSARLK